MNTQLYSERDPTKSMTGYGSAEGQADGLKFTIEIRSVNSRYLDISVHMPRSFIFAEEALKAVVSRTITRGKVDVFVTIDSSKTDDMTVLVNESLAESYRATVTGLSQQHGLDLGLTSLSLARFPDVLRLERREILKEAVSDGLCRIASEAAAEFEEMRTREGERMQDDILERLGETERLCGAVEERSPQTVAEYRKKLEQRMREVLENTAVDENRMLTEAAIFADRTAVSEETVRLRSHFSQMRLMLDGGSPIGRKLDFLVQELNREVNTIGSKGNDAEMARLAVDMKAEIEKIREQVQNIE